MYWPCPQSMTDHGVLIHDNRVFKCTFPLAKNKQFYVHHLTQTWILSSEWIKEEASSAREWQTEATLVIITHLAARSRRAAVELPLRMPLLTRRLTIITKRDLSKQKLLLLWLVLDGVRLCPRTTDHSCIPDVLWSCEISLVAESTICIIWKFPK